jgi:hypothetical protein
MPHQRAPFRPAAADAPTIKCVRVMAARLVVCLRGGSENASDSHIRPSPCLDSALMQSQNGCQLRARGEQRRRDAALWGDESRNLRETHTHTAACGETVVRCPEQRKKRQHFWRRGANKATPPAPRLQQIHKHKCTKQPRPACRGHGRQRGAHAPPPASCCCWHQQSGLF